jgi:hypothetical protein
VYRGFENFGRRVHFFGVLLHFNKQVLQNFRREGTLLSPLTPSCVCIYVAALVKYVFFLKDVPNIQGQDYFRLFNNISAIVFTNSFEGGIEDC